MIRQPRDDDEAAELAVSGSEAPTDELPVPGRRGAGLVAGVTGVALCVLLFMAVSMVIAQITSGGQQQPGPGGLAVGAHVAGFVVGAFCYGVARRRGPRRMFGLIGGLVVLVLLLWFFWWSPVPPA
ncbi:MAG TPA: hypothetical protein VHV49_16835 [Pseudonocardiaceae bacterium]|jgi:hypothetical protein|nr:hypothetical protein [Pseudonocardiaceae bacterium]